MTPQQAMTLRPGDILYHGHQRATYAVLRVERGGRRVSVQGRGVLHYMPPDDFRLLFTAAEVPPDFAIGPTYGEAETQMHRIIAAREARQAQDQENKEEEGKNDHGEKA